MPFTRSWAILQQAGYDLIAKEADVSYTSVLKGVRL